MLTQQESNVLRRARRQGEVAVAWFSEAERACESLVARGWLAINSAATRRLCLVSDASVYAITEEGKKG